MENIAISSGMSEQDALKLKQIIEVAPEVGYICLDVANGYTESFVAFVRNCRKIYPTKTIIVSVLINERPSFLTS